MFYQFLKPKHIKVQSYVNNVENISRWTEDRIGYYKINHLLNLPIVDMNLIAEMEEYLRYQEWGKLNNFFQFKLIENLNEHVKSLKKELKLRDYEIAAFLIKEQFGNANEVLNELVTKNARFSDLSLLKEGKIKDTKEENVKNWLFDHLVAAAEKGDTETVKMLYEAGAPVDRRREEYSRKTALHIAIEKGHLSTARYLIKEAEADVNIADGQNNTALHLAARRGHTDIAHLLCGHGAIIDSKGGGGYTALHEASRHGHLPTVQCLVRRGASLNQQNELGWTPLHLSSCNGHVSIVALLLKNGADAAIKSKGGSTVRDVAGWDCNEEKSIKIESFWDQYTVSRWTFRKRLNITRNGRFDIDDDIIIWI